MHATEQVIDLHIHSTNSDGTDTIFQILNALKKYRATIVSFTDHDSVGAYRDLASKQAALYPGLTVIPGVELSCNFDGNLRDILGYGIDIPFVQAYLDHKYSAAQRLQKQKQILEQLKSICSQQGLTFRNDLRVYTGNKAEAFVVMYHELNQYPENIKKFPFIADNTSFFWDHYSNRSSVFYVDETFNFPSFQETVTVIHQAGGLAFLAHPFAYRMSKEETFRMADEALTAGIDGIELKHSSNQGNDVSLIQAYANKHHLLISGGSDYHGSIKPDRKLVYGYDNICVCFSEIAPWYSSIKKYRAEDITRHIL